MSNKSIIIVRVSDSSQNPNRQMQSIHKYFFDNNLNSVPVYQFFKSGYNGSEAMKPLENPEVEEVFLAHPNRLSRDELEVALMMRARGGKQLKLVFTDLNEIFFISGSSPSQWHPRFIEYLQIAKNASDEKSQVSKDYWKTENSKRDNIETYPPALVEEAQKVNRAVSRISGGRKFKKDFSVGYLQRRYGKFNGKISKKRAGEILEKCQNYTKNTTRIICCKCHREREVSNYVSQMYGANFQCSFLSFTDCTTEEVKEDLDISHGVQSVTLQGESLPTDYYQVETIIDSKISRGKKFYRVRWCGDYTEDKETWEPLENLLQSSSTTDLLIEKNRGDQYLG